MNYIMNDKGEEVIAVGQEGCRARVADQYPALIEKVTAKMVDIYTTNDGIYRNMQYSEIEMMCHDAGVYDYKTVGHIATLSFDNLIKRITQ